MYKIMIIEDDMTIAKTLSEHLRTWGYDTVYAQDFKNIFSEFAKFEPHLVVLDISLPFYNGYHWCEQIRSVSKVPVIFLSSVSDNMNIVMAMNLGGDDFIAKPFDLNVFVAKISALLRRTYSFQGQTSVLEYRGAVLNLNDTTLSYHGTKLELTKNDYRILQVLMEQSGKVISREEIMQRLWENDSYIDDNTLTVNIARLRKKLEEIGLTDFILTKKGIGYMVE